MGHTLEGAVPGPEVKVGGPVVGEVVRELARGAGGGLGDVTGGHGGVEAVSSDNLVDVGGGKLTGVDEGVETVNDNLGASESQHGETTSTTELGRSLGQRREGEERSPMHFGPKK